MTFEQQFFRRISFTQEQIDRYYRSAQRDLQIAREDPHHEVRFTYSYQALIKGAIAIVSKRGYKVRSAPGHHVKLLMAASELLNEPDILAIGDAMRGKRNDDLYGGSMPVTEKEAADYLEFVQSVLRKAERYLRKAS